MPKFKILLEAFVEGLNAESNNKQSFQALKTLEEVKFGDFLPLSKILKKIKI